MDKRPRLMRKVLDAQQRERERVLHHLGTVKGLMPLLMKRRNGGRWSANERAALRNQLRSLADLSPYLVVMVMPGSFVVLPVLAWWLDRRRLQRDRGPGPRRRETSEPGLARPSS